MSAKEALQNSAVAPSVAWDAAKQLFGTQVGDWEPDVFRIELPRRGVEVTDSLMAKLLAAQTVATTYGWAYDHSALFGIALACDGIPASYTEIRQPTVEQLCWAIHEINAIAQKAPTDDDGFDPDEVDAAIAVILISEGFVHHPKELSFCHDVLMGLSSASPELHRQTDEAWKQLEDLPIPQMKGIVSETDEDELGVQLRRLADVKCYIDEKLQQRVQQHASISTGESSNSRDALDAV